MAIEERIEMLEEQNRKLREEIDLIKSKCGDRFVTTKELSIIMHCGVSTIHRKIAEGEIYATRKVGDPRIPLSQFYPEEEQEESEKPKNRYIKKSPEKKREKSIKEMVFR